MREIRSPWIRLRMVIISLSDKFEVVPREKVVGAKQRLDIFESIDILE